jgi:hypothetical protein
MATEVQRVPPHDHQSDSQGGVLPSVSGGVPVLLRAGMWTSVTGATATSIDAVHGIGLLRLTPLPVSSSKILDGLAIEVTAAGEAGATVRLGVYGDNGGGYPGALVADLGTVAADSVGVKALAASISLAAGLYWIGGVIQNVTTTQPTLRSDVAAAVWLGSPSLPAANQKMGAYYMSSVPAALPAAFVTGPLTTGSLLRMFVHVA